MAIRDESAFSKLEVFLTSFAPRKCIAVGTGGSAVNIISNSKFTTMLLRVGDKPFRHLSWSFVNPQVAPQQWRVIIL